jgi:L-fucose isomerase-like protein
MISKPSVGLILLRAEWFDNVVALPELVKGVQQDYDALIAAFPNEVELTQTWVVNSDASLKVCVEALRNLDLDLIILAFQVWAEDYYLQPLVDFLAKRPLVVWCYQPAAIPPRPASFVEVLRYSGPVGTLEGLGTLRNLGAKFEFLVGAPGDSRLNAKIIAEARAGKAYRCLRRARIGLLPGRNEQMQSTFLDEFRLRSDLGPRIIALSVGDLKRAAQNVPQAELDEYLVELRRNYPVHGVNSETLTRAARIALGLTHLADEQRLDILSINDISPEIHTAFGLRPCLYPLQSTGMEVLFGLEGDLGAATAMLVLYFLSASPLFFAEFWFWDELQNFLVGGHAGIQDPRLARPGGVFVSHDYEYRQTDETEGAQLQYACRPGRVTLLQLRCTPSGWQAITLSGEVVDQPAWVEGYPHAIIRPDVKVLDVIRQVAEVGSTQHWIMVYGSFEAEIRAWCRLVNVSLKEITV